VRTGEDLAKTGDRTSAMTAYQQAFGILERLAKDPANDAARRRFAVLHRYVGDMLLIDGKFTEALSYYEKEVQLTESISAADPAEFQGRKLVAGAYGNLGLCLVEMGRVQKGLETLTQSLGMLEHVYARTNASEAHTDVALVSMFIGEAEERLGNTGAAIRRYGRTLQIYSAVTAASPSDASTRVAVAETYDRLGSAHLKAGNAREAHKAYQAALAIANALIATSPLNTEALYALADTEAGLGDTAFAQAKQASSTERTTRMTEARDWYQKSLSHWGQIPNPARISPKGFDVTLPADIQRRMAAAIAR
jgi:tetratricopeptide (TPR) repeat protein